MTDLTIVYDNLGSVTGVITGEGGKILIQHNKTPKGTGSGECTGEEAIDISRVTYLGVAGTRICTCSKCSGNFLL